MSAQTDDSLNHDIDAARGRISLLQTLVAVLYSIVSGISGMKQSG